jgi:hypothetical protein
MLFELTAPIQVAVLDGFGDVIDLNMLLAFQIRYGASDFQYAVKGPGGKSQLVDGRLQQAARGVVDLAVRSDVAAAHFGVAKDFAAAKALGLHITGGGHPPADVFRGLGR